MNSGEIETIIGCLKGQRRLELLSPNESKFASGLISYYDHKGALTEKQFRAGKKLVIRVLMEKDHSRLIPH